MIDIDKLFSDVTKWIICSIVVFFLLIVGFQVGISKQIKEREPIYTSTIHWLCSMDGGAFTDCNDEMIKEGLGNE